MKARWSVVILLAVVAVSCDIKGDNVPLAQVKYGPPKALYWEGLRLEPASPLEGVEVDLAGRRWQASATEYDMPDRYLRSVGSADGRSFYAFTWDRAPYDRLLTPTTDGRWREFLELY